MSALPDRLADLYAAAAPGLPGAAARRERALAAFRRQGLPTQRLESWKFTSLNAVEKRDWALAAKTTVANDSAPALAAHRLVFNGGHFDAAASSLGTLPDGVTLTPLAAGTDFPDAAVPDAAGHALVALNTALSADGWLLDIAPGVGLHLPVHVICHGAAGLANPAFSLRLGAGAQATLVESHRAGAAPGWSNIAGRIALGKGAALSHVRLQTEAAEAIHSAYMAVTLAEAARYHHVSLMLGGAVARHEMAVTLAGEGAAADLFGLCLARGKAHLDHTLRLEHASPGCRSSQSFKHVVDDRGHAVFQGGIRVAPDAQRTDAQQITRTLLLSDHAQVDAKPELEILADDVKCSHGASIGDLDAGMLFYLRARGLDAAEAQRLMLAGFAWETVEAIADQEIRAHAASLVDGWLQAGGA